MEKRFLRKYDGKKQGWLRQGKELIIFLIAAFIVFRFLVGVSLVKGDSMSPTLTDGQAVVYLRVVPKFNRGDVVSVRMPSGEYYIKRVIAVGGDTLELSDGKVYLNGELLEEDYAAGETWGQKDEIEYPYVVEENRMFVIGDNREVSVDSRTFGSVSRRQIKGRVLFSIPL